MVWRLMSWSGGSSTVRDLLDVRALRVAVLELRRDPRVDGFRWLRVFELEPRPSGCPRCGEAYVNANVSRWACYCGVPHVAYYCMRCRRTDIEPPPEPYCGRIPVDHEGIAARYTRKRWRRSG